MTTAEPLRSPALTNGNGHGPILGDGPIAETGSTFESSIFREYLLALLPPVLGASLEELDTLFDDEFDERVSRFAAEGGAVIYVVKVRDEAEGECYFVQLKELILMERRRCTPDLLLSVGPPFELLPFTCNITRTDQTSTHAGSVNTPRHSTAHSEPFRGGRDPLRKSARGCEQWDKALV